MNAYTDYTQLPPEKLDEIADYVCEKFDEFRRSDKRRKVKERVAEARTAYDQDTEPATEPWEGASNMKFPLDTITVDHMVPRLFATIAGKDPILNMEDFGTLDKQYREDIIKFDNYVLKNDVKLPKILDSWLHTMAVDGQRYMLVHWEREKIKRRDFVVDPLAEQGLLTEENYYQNPGLYQGEMVPYLGMMMHEFEETVHDGAKITFVDFDDVYFPDRIDDWEEAPVLRKYWETWEAYKYKAEKAKFRGWLKPGKELLEEFEGALYEKRPEADEELRLEVPDTEDRSSTTEEGKLKQELLFIEGHVCWDVDGDGIQEKIIVRAEYNTRKCVYIRNNNELDMFNRKQLRMTSLFPEPGTGYGYGFFHKLRQIRDGASTLFNTLVNSAVIAMLPWFIYEEGAGFEEQEPELHPGKGVKVKDADKVKFPSINANAALFKDFLNFYIGLWERIVGLSDYSLGRESESVGKKGSTATGTMAIIQEGQIVHEYRGLTIQKQFEEIFEIIHDLYYLNMPPGLDAAVLGKPLDRRLMSRNYKLKLMGSTVSANRYNERLEVQEALMIGEQGAKMGLVNPEPLLRMYFKTIRNLDVDEVLAGPMAGILERLFNPQEGDPFAPLVSDMSQKPPEELAQDEMTRQVGQQVKGELEEEMQDVVAGMSQAQRQNRAAGV
jgi:hypothetical protein